MAKIGEKVFHFKDVLESSRVPVSCAADQWFLNVGRNSIVNVRDMKTLHTWTLMHPHYFTDSVVHSSGNLYCIMDKKILLKWSIDEDNLKNAEKIEFQDSVFTLIAINGSKQLILFDSGKFAMIESTFSDTKPSDFLLLKKNEEFIWADACISATATEIFALVKNKKNENRFLHHFTVTEESTSFHSCSISRENASLKCWCLNPFDLCILSLWSDGMICSHNIKESKTEKLVTVKGIDSETIVAVDNVDSTHIAVAKGHPKQQECSLEIWDLECSILKTSKILKTPSLNSMQIAAVNSYIFLCFDKELMVVPCKLKDTTFLAALGMSESSTFEQHSWNTDLELNECTTIDEPEPMEISSATHDSLDSVQLIAEKLMNQDSLDLMCIPESELVRILRLALRHKKEENADKKDLKRYLYILLNITFSASFNNVLLTKCLKRMDLDETLTALQLLLSYFNHTVCLPSDIIKRPSDLQIVNWASLIIQSHTETLLSSKDKTTRRLLKQFAKALDLMKMVEYEEFYSMQQNFSIIKKKDILPQKCSDGKYCIENLEI